MTEFRVSAKRFAKWFLGALLILIGVLLGAFACLQMCKITSSALFILAVWFGGGSLAVIIFTIFIRPGIKLILSQDNPPPDKETEEFLKAIKK